MCCGHVERRLSMNPKLHPPLWGNFVAYADNDLLAFGLLVRGGLIPLGLYHGVQAIEKYFKAVVLSVIDPAGDRETPFTQPWIRTHDLNKLSAKCGETVAFYKEPDVLANLMRLREFDQATRYPWVHRTLGSGFDGNDVDVIADICKQLRNDLPIALDNYQLGMDVRGYYHGDRAALDPARAYRIRDAVTALRSIVPSLSDFVRGWDVRPQE